MESESAEVRGRHNKRPQKNKKVLMIGAVAAVLVVAVVAVVWVWGFMASSLSGIDSSKYQAVFFTNGQVYFGKLSPQNSEYMKLTDIYYLQTKAADPKNPQKTAGQQAGNDVELIKLGQELHGPVDEMIISKSQVLFYENLKAEGTVAKTIEQHQAKNPKQ